MHRKSSRRLRALGTVVAVLAASFAITACGSRPQLVGAVTPMAGGQAQSVVKAADKVTAMRHFDHDAKLHCGERGAVRMLDKVGKYVVVQQDVKEKSHKIGSSGDAKLDAGIAVGMRRLGMERPDDVEVTTLFKCEG